MIFADLIVKCATAALFNRSCGIADFLQLSASEQDEALCFAAKQGVISLVISILNQSDELQEIPDEMYPWVGIVLQIENDYRTRIATMKQLAGLFGTQGLDVMFLKGATLARFYPCHDWRPWSDIDYYMFGKAADSIRLLETIGVKTNEYYHHHTQSSLNGILIENHYDFFDRHNHKCNHLLDDAMKELAKSEGKSFPFVFDDAPDIGNAYLMSPTMNAIFLVRHMSAHFVSETVTLRQLYDFALFLKAEGQKVDWQKVVELYKKSGMLQIAQVFVSIIDSKLGVALNKDECPLVAEKSPMVEKVWQSIISIEGGNPFKRYGFRYMVYEVKTFVKNRWKHSLVYPDESYARLFFIYAWSHIKRIIMNIKGK